jgi:hypothetical protein
MKRIGKYLLAAALALALCQDAIAAGKYREFVLAASGAVTATGAGATVSTLVNAIGYETPGGRFLVDVTAVTGTTPSATFSLQTVVNGVVFTLASCTALTAVGQCVLAVDQAPTDLRVQYAISGTTPSFTFSSYFVRQ